MARGTPPQRQWQARSDALAHRSLFRLPPSTSSARTETGKRRGSDGMKAMGPIPPEFAEQKVLTIAGRDAEHWIAEAGDTPLFVYDFGIVRARIERLRRALPEAVDLH